MYDYRKMTAEQQDEVVSYRKLHRRPHHSPPHCDFVGARQFILSGTCYEHAPIIGTTHQRMTECEGELLAACEPYISAMYAWCILPNHYHMLLRTDSIKALCKAIGLFHGRKAYAWNGADQQRGRKVWFNVFDRPIESHRHFWASVNYIHHNPIKHGYVDKWQDWPWSSASDWLATVGPTRARELWRKFPVLDYGKHWDWQDELAESARAEPQAAPTPPNS